MRSSTAEQKTCPYCGQLLKVHYRYCIRCGQLYPPQPPAQPPAEPTDPPETEPVSPS